MNYELIVNLNETTEIIKDSEDFFNYNFFILCDLSGFRDSNNGILNSH